MTLWIEGFVLFRAVMSEMFGHGYTLCQVFLITVSLWWYVDQTKSKALHLVSLLNFHLFFDLERPMLLVSLQVGARDPHHPVLGLHTHRHSLASGIHLHRHQHVFSCVSRFPIVFWKWLFVPPVLCMAHGRYDKCTGTGYRVHGYRVQGTRV